MTILQVMGSSIPTLEAYLASRRGTITIVIGARL